MNVKSIREKIRDDFINDSVNIDDVYEYVYNKTYTDYLREAIDRELVWKREFEANKNKIMDKVKTKISKADDLDKDVIVDDADKEDKNPKVVETPKVVKDFKKLHEKIKRIMDDIVSIYSLYGEQLKESVDVSKYTKMFLEDIQTSVADVKNIVDFCDEMDYDTYNDLCEFLNNAHIFVIFIKD